MTLFDSNLRKFFFNYIFQSLLAGISIAVILCFINFITKAAIVASLGSSIFIVFAMPKRITARPRNLIGGHLAGVISGIIFSFIANARGVFPHIFCAAAAVGLSIFLMCITNTQHPPASGTALGLIAHQWDTGTIGFILTSVVLLAVIKYGLRNYLKDLL